MRLARERLKGFTIFKQPVEIDFEAFGPGIIAFVGDKGAGKTTLIEGVLDSLYLRGGQRSGNLYEYTSGTDAFVETEFIDDDTGDRYRQLVNVDADRSKTEAYIFKNNVALTTGRQAEFEAQVEKLFGSRRLVLSSIFAAQDKTGNFVAMKKAERKELFSELLDLSGVRLLHAMAKEMRDELDRDLTSARRRVSELIVELEPHASLLSEMEASGSTLESQRSGLSQLRDRAATLQATRQQLDRVLIEIDATTRRLSELAQQANVADSSVRNIEQYVSDAERLFNSRVAELEAAVDEEAVQRLIDDHSRRRSELSNRLERTQRVAGELAAVEEAESQVTQINELKRRMAAAIAVADSIGRDIEANATERKHALSLIEIQEAELTRAANSTDESTLAAEWEIARKLLETQINAAQSNLAREREAKEQATNAHGALIEELTVLFLKRDYLARLNELRRGAESSAALAQTNLGHEQRAERATLENLTAQAARITEFSCAPSATWVPVTKDTLRPHSIESALALSQLCPAPADARAAKQRLDQWVSPESLTLAESHLQAAIAERERLDGEIRASGLIAASIVSEIERVSAAIRELLPRLSNDLEELYTESVDHAQTRLRDEAAKSQTRIAEAAARRLAAEEQLGQLETRQQQSLAGIDARRSDLDQRLATNEREQNTLALTAQRWPGSLDEEMAKAQAIANRRPLVDDAISSAASLERELAAFILQARQEQRAKELQVAAATADLLATRADYEQQHAELEARLLVAREDKTRTDTDRGLCEQRKAGLSIQLEGSNSIEIDREIADTKELLISNEQLVNDTTRQHGQLEARVDAMNRMAAVLETEQSRLQQRETDLGDWRLIEAGFGPNGVQALEIDAAAPVISTIANTLISSSDGTRFSIKFETLRPLKSKPGEFSEVFEIWVYDKGEVRRAELLSVGEQAFISEAISMSIAVHNAERSGVRWKTVFRDETVANLDVASALNYMSMVRTMREMGKFHQVIIISHVREVQEAADVRVYVGNGKVSVNREEVEIAA